MDGMEHIQALAADDFTIFRAWLGDQSDGQIICKKNLGIAFGVLRLWDRAAAHLEALEENDITKETQGCLIVSLMESRLYDKVVNTVASLDSHSLLPFKLRFKLKFLLGCACKGRGDVDGAIAAFEASGVTHIMQFPITVIRLHQLYAEKGDMDGIIKIYENVVAQYPSLWWGWQLLCVASLAPRDIKASVEVYQRAFAEKHETVKAWAAEGLGIVDLNKGMESVENN